jgi:hypothetical protein
MNIASGSNDSSTVSVVSAGGNINTLCFPSNVQSVESSGYVVLYPNPASGSFTLAFSDQWQIKNGRLQILNLTGRVVHKQPIGNKQSSIINNSFSPGVYFVKVSNGKREEVHKLIIE